MAKEKVSPAQVKKLQEGVPKEGMAEIVLKYPTKTGSITLRDYSYEDGEGNYIYRPFVDSKGSSRVFIYKKQKMLNLKRENDRLEFAHALNHPLFTKGPRAVLIVRNLEAEADTYIEERDLVSKVNALIQKLEGKELLAFARVLKRKFNTGSTPSAVKRSVYELADEDPKLVLEEWEDSDRPLKEMLRMGIANNSINISNGRWKYGEMEIGNSFEQSLDWLKSNDDFQPKLRKEAYK
jgi:hypothetical protein